LSIATFCRPERTISDRPAKLPLVFKGGLTNDLPTASSVSELETSYILSRISALFIDCQTLNTSIRKGLCETVLAFRIADLLLVLRVGQHAHFN
jgi:hypothetical protein